MSEMRKVCGTFVERHQGKRPLERRRRYRKIILKRILEM